MNLRRIITNKFYDLFYTGKQPTWFKKGDYVYNFNCYRNMKVIGYSDYLSQIITPDGSFNYENFELANK